MPILLGLILAIIAGLLAAKLTEDEYGMNAVSFVAFLFSGFGIVVLILALISLTLHPHDIRARLRSHEAIRETITAARDRGESFENATFLLRVSESNEWLARQQHYNTTLWDIWIPDEVMRTEPIR